MNIVGFDCFKCPWPKLSSNASGGVIVYFKHHLSTYIELESLDEKGIVWFKLNKELLYLTTDTYFCCCPRKPNSVIYDVDFYEYLNSDIRKYSDLGNVWWFGDMNGRTGKQSDYIPDLHIDCYIDVPAVKMQHSYLNVAITMTM